MRFWREWQKYQPYLYRCCLKWMRGNEMDAEDALSESMFKAWHKVGNRPESIFNYKSWLYKLTHNVCVDIQRKKNRRKNKIVYLDGVDESKVLSLMQEDANLSLEEEEKRNIIAGEIQNLPDRIRETFILHYYGDLSYQEIAEKQSISYANVRKRVSEGRSMLTGELTPYFLVA
ncbi:RNA polymerase sigma factor [Roseofilum sp. BLCC_M91]|uniref:RNA polymerase sigma factor n=1 Tax=Roseofilum halophilum BLCC-M91 TaxID=3022259 RepID=A0ABT7BE46_9CYAN|nr:RNA polymerase sigma factor [Roseofilum halophilum]MDJ1177446.1 RNA polymerase sigma factor [Roseofilum halophilum BLCC-M91]